MKKQNIKKSNKVSVFKPTVNKVYGLAISVLLIITIVQSFFIWYMWEYQKRESIFSFGDKVIHSIDNVYNLGSNNVVYDYSSNKVLMPEENLMLPMYKNIKGLSTSPEYDYDNKETAIPESLSQIDITYYEAYRVGQNNLNVTSVGTLFKDITRANACARLATLYFSSNKPDYVDPEFREYVFSKTLSDGRQIHAYKSTVCNFQADEFLEYLKQIDSY